MGLQTKRHHAVGTQLPPKLDLVSPPHQNLDFLEGRKHVLTTNPLDLTPCRWHPPLHQALHRPERSSRCRLCLPATQQRR